MSHPTTAPWYKEPWAWFLLAVLASAVAIGMFLLFIAIKDADTLVVDSYYKDGKAINQNLSRDHRARDLELRGQLQIDSLIGEVRVALSGQLQQWPEQLQLSLLSPTRAIDDIKINLLRTPAGDYLGQLPEQVQGRRYVQLETLDRPQELTELNGRDALPGWRISTQLTFDQRLRYSLEPALR